MDTLLVILAVLIIGAIIIAVVFIKKRSTAFDEEIEETLSDPIEEAPTDPIVDQAEVLIKEHRYHEATSELKRILMSDPSNTAAMSKLLQVYGITNNHHAFNKLYQKINEIGDSQAIQQANFYRFLLEDNTDFDSHVATKTTPPVATPATGNESTSIQLDETAKQHHKPDLHKSKTSSVGSTDSVDKEYADLDFDQPKQPAQPKPEDPTSATENDGADNVLDFDDFDFNFEVTDAPTPTTKTAETTNAAETVATEFDSSLDDFSLDSDALSSDVEDSGVEDSGVEDPLSSNDGLAYSPAENDSKEEGLSFDGFDLEDSKSSFDLDDLDNDDHEFDSDDSHFDDKPFFDDEPKATQPTQADNDLSFGLEDTSKPEDRPTDSLTEGLATRQPTDLDEGFNFELTEDLVSQSQKDDQITQEKSFEFELDDLVDDSDDQTGSDDHALSGDHTASGDDAVSDNDTLLDDALLIDDEALTDDKLSLGDTQQQTALQEFDLSGEMNADESKQVNEPVLAEKQTALVSDFDFVDELDKSQITLDLANQYLSLGENDSAKRLLQEVVEFGNHNQQSAATTILKRIG